MSSTSADTSVLVVCNGGGIGDVLLATPVMRALRQRYSRITVLTKAAHAEVIADEAADEVWCDTADVTALRRRIVAGGFDAAVVTWATARTAFLLASTGIPVRVGQARRLYSPLFTRRVTVTSELGDRTTSWAQILLRYARALDCDGDPTPFAPIDAPSDADARALLHELGLAEGGFLILHPTRGISSQREQWPLSALAETGIALRERFGLPVLISGSIADREGAAAVARRVGGTSIAGRVSLRGFASLAKAARLVVAMDSGPMHIAAATGTPTVGIFAMRPDEPDRWHPIGRATAVVRPNFPCPISHTKENCPDFACVRALDPQRVANAAAGLLEAFHEQAP